MPLVDDNILAAESGDVRPVVLVVEDHPTIRALVVEMLRQEGYRVVEAASDAAARELIVSEDIDVLLTDIDLMRGDEGVRLAALARTKQPTIGVIYASGGPPPSNSRVCGSLFIPKPYGMGSVLKAIAAVLSPGSADAFLAQPRTPAAPAFDLAHS